MSEQIDPKNVFVRCDEGSVILEIRNPDGSCSRIALTSEPDKELSVREAGKQYRPGGTVLDELLPDSVEELQGRVARHTQKIMACLEEAKVHLCGIFEIVSEKGDQVEEYERACAGDR